MTTSSQPTTGCPLQDIWAGELRHKQKRLARLTAWGTNPLPFPVDWCMDVNKKISRAHFTKQVLTDNVIQLLQFGTWGGDSEQKLQLCQLQGLKTDTVTWTAFCQFLQNTEVVAMSLIGPSSYLFLVPLRFLNPVLGSGTASGMRLDDARWKDTLYGLLYWNCPLQWPGDPPQSQQSPQAKPTTTPATVLTNKTSTSQPMLSVKIQNSNLKAATGQTGSSRLGRPKSPTLKANEKKLSVRSTESQKRTLQYMLSKYDGSAHSPRLTTDVALTQEIDAGSPQQTHINTESAETETCLDQKESRVATTRRSAVLGALAPADMATTGGSTSKSCLGAALDPILKMLGDGDANAVQNLLQAVKMVQTATDNKIFNDSGKPKTLDIKREPQELAADHSGELPNTDNSINKVTVAQCDTTQDSPASKSAPVIKQEPVCELKNEPAWETASLANHCNEAPPQDVVSSHNNDQKKTRQEDPCQPEPPEQPADSGLGNATHDQSECIPGLALAGSPPDVVAGSPPDPASPQAPTAPAQYPAMSVEEEELFLYGDPEEVTAPHIPESQQPGRAGRHPTNTPDTVGDLVSGSLSHVAETVMGALVMRRRKSSSSVGIEEKPTNRQPLASRLKKFTKNDLVLKMMVETLGDDNEGSNESAALSTTSNQNSELSASDREIIDVLMLYEQCKTRRSSQTEPKIDTTLDTQAFHAANKRFYTQDDTHHWEDRSSAEERPSRDLQGHLDRVCGKERSSPEVAKTNYCPDGPYRWPEGSIYAGNMLGEPMSSVKPPLAPDAVSKTYSQDNAYRWDRRSDTEEQPSRRDVPEEPMHKASVKPDSTCKTYSHDDAYNWDRRSNTEELPPTRDLHVHKASVEPPLGAEVAIKTYPQDDAYTCRWGDRRSNTGPQTRDLHEEHMHKASVQPPFTASTKSYPQANTYRWDRRSNTEELPQSRDQEHMHIDASAKPPLASEPTSKSYYNDDAYRWSNTAEEPSTDQLDQVHIKPHTVAEAPCKMYFQEDAYSWGDRSRSTTSRDVQEDPRNRCDMADGDRSRSTTSQDLREDPQSRCDMADIANNRYWQDDAYRWAGRSNSANQACREVRTDVSLKRNHQQDAYGWGSGWPDAQDMCNKQITDPACETLEEAHGVPTQSSCSEMITDEDILRLNLEAECVSDDMCSGVDNDKSPRKLFQPDTRRARSWSFGEEGRDVNNNQSIVTPTRNRGKKRKYADAEKDKSPGSGKKYKSDTGKPSLQYSVRKRQPECSPFRRRIWRRGNHTSKSRSPSSERRCRPEVGRRNKRSLRVRTSRSASSERGTPKKPRKASDSRSRGARRAENRSSSDEEHFSDEYLHNCSDTRFITLMWQSALEMGRSQKPLEKLSSKARWCSDVVIARYRVAFGFRGRSTLISSQQQTREKLRTLKNVMLTFSHMTKVAVFLRTGREFSLEQLHGQYSRISTTKSILELMQRRGNADQRVVDSAMRRCRELLDRLDTLRNRTPPGASRRERSHERSRDRSHERSRERSREQSRGRRWAERDDWVSHNTDDVAMETKIPASKADAINKAPSQEHKPPEAPRRPAKVSLVAKEGVGKAPATTAAPPPAPSATATAAAAAAAAAPPPPPAPSATATAAAVKTASPGTPVPERPPSAIKPTKSCTKQPLTGGIKFNLSRMLAAVKKNTQTAQLPQTASPLVVKKEAPEGAALQPSGKK